METQGLIIVIIVLAATGFYFIELPMEENLIIDFETNKNQITTTEKLNVKVRAENATIKQIIIELGEETKNKQCNETRECLFETEFNPKKGIYSLKIIVETTTETLEETKKITVIDETNKCVNNILFGQCAGEKPLYCNNGILEDNCENCGCEETAYCSNTSCEPKAAPVKLVGIDYPKEVLAGRGFEIIINAELLENIFNGSKYDVQLKIGEKEIIKQFTLDEAKKGEILELKIRGITLEPGTHDLNATIFSLNQKKEITGNIFVENAVTARTTFPKPKTPTITSIFAEGDDVIISWNTIDEATEYKLYKSVDANPVFISYKYYQSFNPEQTSGVIQALEQGTHFFVLTAANDLGGESDYSEVATGVIG
ncbi:hypothetical protein IIC68_01340 [archaeon]|nr:hypothetical protein [archaeon]